MFLLTFFLPIIFQLLKLHSQTDKISSVGPHHHLPNILGQKAESTTKLTLFELPVNN